MTETYLATLIRAKHPEFSRYTADWQAVSCYSRSGVRLNRMRTLDGEADAIARSETLHDYDRAMLALHRELSNAPTRHPQATGHSDR